MVVESRPPDDPVIDTQVKVLSSRSNIHRVIEKLGLERDPELNLEPSTVHRSADVLLREWLVLAMPNTAGAAKEGERPAAHGSRDEQLEAVADRFLDKLKVGRDGQSHVVSVSFTSKDPQKAAEIANAVVRSYVDIQVEANMSAIGRASSWFSEQLKSLRDQLLESERAVEAYRAATDLMDGQEREKGTLDAQRLDSLNAELIAARVEIIAKDNKLQQVKQLRAKGEGYTSLAEVASSPFIVNLLQREAELASQEAHLTKTYGEKHPLIIQVRAERDGLATKINQEVTNILRNIENEARLAQARERALEQSLKQAKEESAGIGRAGIQLHELEREAASRRSVYEAALVRSKEVQQQGDLLEPDARVISAAAVPTEPSFPKLGVMTTIAFLASSVLGIVLAALREHFDRGFRTGRELEQGLGLSTLGFVPSIRGAERRQRPHRYLLEKPLSRYAEAVKAIATAITLSLSLRPRVILVTSSLPGEGKTTLAMSLGATLARSGHKTVVVDLDLRHPGLARELGQPIGAGIVEFLEGERILEDIVCQDAGEPSLHVIAVKRRSRSPLDLLGSPQMRSLVAELRRRYEYVVLNSSPTLVVSDAKVAALLADAVLFVVQWEKTAETAAENGLEALRKSRAPVIGAALTQVNMRRHATYGYSDDAQYHAKYHKYFVN